MRNPATLFEEIFGTQPQVRILEILLQTGESTIGIPISTIMRRSGCSKRVTAHYLNVLMRLGIVKERSRKKVAVYYVINTTTFFGQKMLTIYQAEKLSRASVDVIGTETVIQADTRTNEKHVEDDVGVQIEARMGTHTSAVMSVVDFNKVEESLKRQRE